MFSKKIEGWKNIMAGFAGFGFILSLVLGVIGGVVFGVIILRALLFAALFAGLSLAVMKVIENFVPEFLDGNDFDEDAEILETSVIIEEDSDQDNTGQAMSGRNLDITIDDEGDDLGAADGVDELGEPDDESEADEMEELEGADDPETVGDERPAEKTAAARDSGESDKPGLPDIDVYSDSFEPIAGNEDSDGLSSIDGSGSSGSTEILGGMHDTQEIVKAVKTVLKKDQEG